MEYNKYIWGYLKNKIFIFLPFMCFGDSSPGEALALLFAPAKPNTCCCALRTCCKPDIPLGEMQLAADVAKLLTFVEFGPCCTTFAMLPTAELLEVLWAA